MNTPYVCGFSSIKKIYAGFSLKVLFFFYLDFFLMVKHFHGTFMEFQFCPYYLQVLRARDDGGIPLQCHIPRGQEITFLRTEVFIVVFRYNFEIL